MAVYGVEMEDLLTPLGRDLAIGGFLSAPKIVWHEVWPIGLLCFLIGVFVCLALIYFFKWDIFWSASIGILACFLLMLFTRNKSLIGLGTFVLSSIVLTIILTFFVFLVFDLLRRYR